MTTAAVEPGLEQAQQARAAIEARVDELERAERQLTRRLRELETRRESLVVPAYGGDERSQTELEELDREIQGVRLQANEDDDALQQCREDLQRAESAVAAAEAAEAEERRLSRMEELRSELEQGRARLQGLIEALLPELEWAVEADRELVRLLPKQDYEKASLDGRMQRELGRWLQRNLGKVLPGDFDAHYNWMALGNEPLEVKVSDEPARVTIEE